MNRKLEKLEGTYWKIGKVIGTLFTIINYQMWTSPFNIAVAILLIIGIPKKSSDTLPNLILGWQK